MQVYDSCDDAPFWHILLQLCVLAIKSFFATHPTPPDTLQCFKSLIHPQGNLCCTSISMTKNSSKEMTGKWKCLEILDSGIKILTDLPMFICIVFSSHHNVDFGRPTIIEILGSNHYFPIFLFSPDLKMNFTIFFVFALFSLLYHR